VVDALPGASIDTLFLDRIEGVSDPSKSQTGGQTFHVVAHDSYTGNVVAHSKYEPIHFPGCEPDRETIRLSVRSKIGPVPESVFARLGS
jgi:hypothetical protein